MALYEKYLPRDPEFSPSAGPAGFSEGPIFQNFSFTFQRNVSGRQETIVALYGFSSFRLVPVFLQSAGDSRFRNP